VTIPTGESVAAHVGRTNYTIVKQKKGRKDKQSSTKNYTKNQRMRERKETLILFKQNGHDLIIYLLIRPDLSS
jgi:hypothetical protein